MLDRLLDVAPRSNDPLAQRRARTLALFSIVLILSTAGVGLFAIAVHDTPIRILNTFFTLLFLCCIYIINRSGRLRLAITLLLVGLTLVLTGTSLTAGTPIPNVYFLGVLVVISAVFERPHAPLTWAAVHTGTLFVLNVLLYGSLLAPTTPIPELALASILPLEIGAIAFMWIVAGATYLTSQMLHEAIEESQATTAKILEINQALRQSEAALRESEQRYRLITENTSDLIAMFDQDSRILYASPSYQTMLGYDPATLVGTTTFLRIHPDDQARLQNGLATLSTDGRSEAMIRLRHADGSWRWFETSATATSWGGKPCFIGRARDVTERKRLEEQLLQSQKMESIGRLAGGVAHDFNNLLTVIIGHADLVYEMLPPDDPMRSDMGELLKAAERASSLTRQLLAFARKQIFEPRVLNLNDLILDMDRLLRRLIGENIELVTRPDADLGWVKVDPGQIEQVIVNLAINARDAMPNGGRLTIETLNAVLDQAYIGQYVEAPIGPYVLLGISDTGVGMDAEVKAHLFEPFFTTKNAGKGTGLGLATCYGIVKQHGGIINCYSEVGHGTTFKIYLPRVEEQPTAEGRSVATAEIPRGDETVLLVEDEEAVRGLTARMLREQGYTVLEAPDGEEALRLAQSNGEAPIHLLLTDVVMPRMSGIALARQLKELFPTIKVLFMSGYTDNTIVHHGWLDPGIAFLHKPFSPAALARKVREVLDS